MKLLLRSLVLILVISIGFLFSVCSEKKPTAPEREQEEDKELVNKITFVSDRDGNQEIYVMNADGNEQVNLTNNPANESYASWIQ